MASSVPYDPYIPSQQTGTSKTQDIQNQVDGTVDIMRQNLNLMAERGGQLDALQDKTDNLAVAAKDFQRGASRVRKQMWWKDMKMRLCLLAGVIILIIVIVVPIAVHFS